jgi:hypothetical protein
LLVPQKKKKILLVVLVIEKVEEKDVLIVEGVWSSLLFFIFLIVCYCYLELCGSGNRKSFDIIIKEFWSLFIIICCWAPFSLLEL